MVYVFPDHPCLQYILNHFVWRGTYRGTSQVVLGLRYGWMSFLSVPDGWRHVVSDGMSDLAKDTPDSLGGRLLCTLGEFYETPGYQLSIGVRILKHDIALTPEATRLYSLSHTTPCPSLPCFWL